MLANSLARADEARSQSVCEPVLMTEAESVSQTCGGCGRISRDVTVKSREQQILKLSTASFGPA